jgi:hypothetical protein
MGKARSMHGENAYKILVGKHEGKRPFGRPKRGWEDNVKWTVNQNIVRVWTGFVCISTGPSAWPL